MTHCLSYSIHIPSLTLPDLSFLSFIYRTAPSPLRQTVYPTLSPSNFTFLYICSSCFSFSATIPHPLDFLLPHLNHIIFPLFPPFNTAAPFVVLSFLCGIEAVCCTGVPLNLIGALSLNSEACFYLIQEQKEGLWGLRGLLYNSCLSDWKTVECGIQRLLCYLMQASKKLQSTYSKWMNAIGFIIMLKSLGELNFYLKKVKRFF